MILRAAEVRKYKCISESGQVKIDPKLTCLVGRNESGKTAFLEALYRANPQGGVLRNHFDQIHDYPRRSRSAEQDLIPTTQPVRLELELRDDDVVALESILGKGGIASRRVVFSKSYANEPHWQLSISPSNVLRHLGASPRLGPWSADETADLNRFESRLETLGPGSGVGDALQTFRERGLKAKAFETLTKRLPRLLYFHSGDLAPGRFSIPHIQSAAPQELTPGETMALCLLRLAGLESADPQTFAAPEAKSALESAASTLSGKFLNYWCHDSLVRIELGLDWIRAEKDEKEPPYLEIRVWNDFQRLSLNLGERSSGLIWFFAFMAFISVHCSDAEPAVILLDEPAQYLHPSVQTELLRFIRDDLSRSHQVIYATHSPFMVDAGNLEKIRVVEDYFRTGTRISNQIGGRLRDTVLPVNVAIGYQIAQSIFTGPATVLVGDFADAVFLEIMSELLRRIGRSHLREEWSVVSMGQCQNIAAWATLAPEDSTVVALIGKKNGHSIGDHSGDEVAPMRVSSSNATAEAQLARLDELFSKEFLGSLRSYLPSSLNPGGTADTTNPGEGDKRGLTQRLRLGRTLMRHQDALLTHLDPDTIRAFESLFTQINEAIHYPSSGALPTLISETSS